MKYSFLIVFCLLLTGCSMDSGELSNLEGSWLLTEIDAEETFSSPGEEEIILTFENGGISGRTEGNILGGTYAVPKDGHLIIPGFSSTNAADTEWGSFFFESFNRAYTAENQQWVFNYSVSDDNLNLTVGEDQSTVLKFIRN